ncbi:MAG TPA: protein kinase [Polyangiaceae bacterium]|nr:protein kinase [Polyangiaceae bacterium]
MRAGELVASRFELDRITGSGGMGEVWRALDRETSQPVALKVVLHQSPDQIARFRREAQVLSELQHPRIARYVDHGVTEGGQHYLAMEWVEGEDLASRLQRGPLSVDESLTLVEHVAEALGVVHARGIVHRDIKPANLALPRGQLDQVKVLDFGIAHLSEATHRLTDAPIGTPAYMAPEQVRNEPDIDARADVYALGGVLYECLTGRPPFMAEHVVAILTKVLFDEPPRPSELRRDVSSFLDALVARLMAKDRARRPLDGAAAAEAVRAPALSSRSFSDAAMSSGPPSGLTGRERRLVSVVLAAPGAREHEPPNGRGALQDQVTLDAGSATLPDQGAFLADLRSVAQTFGASLELLRDGSVAAVLVGGGAPTDLAARAARCALSLQSRLAGAPVSLATGWEVVEGVQPLGQVIDRAAAQLAARASTAPEAPGSVLADAMTAALLGPRFEVIKSDQGPVIAGERASFDEVRTLLGKPTPCVGRDRELRALQDAFEECVSEPCAQAVLVTAAVGMGKSRLRLELLRRLRDRGLPLEILVAHGDPVRAGAPLGLLGELLSRAAQLAIGEPAAGRREKLAARVAHSVDAAERARVTEFLGEIVSARSSDADSVQLHAARQDPMLMGDQMRRAWVDFVRAECRQRPLVIVLEDLHWGDLPTIEFLDAALRLLRSEPLFVLALARPEVRETYPKLWAERGLTNMQLGELSTRACERLVRAALGEQAPSEGVDTLVQRASGHPFLLEELVRAAAEGRDAREVPETALAMVQARIEGLDPEARRILRAGSIFGEVFWQGALATLLGQEREIPVLAARLVDLERRELIGRRMESTLQGEVEYAFQHDLVREAAYVMLTDADRQLGHQLAGAWLEQRGEKDGLLLAEHFARGGQLAQAATWYERAAEQALEASDLEAVIARVEEALACGAEGEAAGRLKLMAATAHNWRASFEEGLRCAREAADLFPHGSEQWHAALERLAWASGATANVEQLEAVARDLHQTTPVEGLRLNAISARCSTSIWFYGLGRYASAYAYSELLESVQPGSVEPLLAAHLHEWRSFRRAMERKLEHWLQEAKAQVAAFERAGASRNACAARLNTCGALMAFGMYSPAETILQGVLQEAERLGLTFPAEGAQIMLGAISAARGGSESDLLMVAKAAEAARTRGSAFQEGQARVTLARIWLALGALEKAEGEAQVAIEITSSSHALNAFAEAVMAQILLRAERPVEALAAAKKAKELLDSLGTIEDGDALVRLVFAEALHAVGDIDGARAALSTAHESILRDAQQIRDEALRRSFFNNVPEHARILALDRAWDARAT